MEFFPLGGCSSKNTGVEESDLLKQVGECCDEELMDGGVDCTLSLGSSSSTRSGVGYVESIDVVGSKKGGGGGGGGGGHARAVPGGRRCMKCGKTETPLWRNGPNGAKSLCNACGIRFKKEERRASLMLLGMANSSDTKIAEASDDKGAHIALELGTYKDPNGPCHY